MRTPQPSPHDDRLDTALGEAGTGFTEGAGPHAQQIIAGGEVTCHADVHRLGEYIVDLAPVAELRAIAAVRAWARDATTFGETHWQGIRCAVTPATTGHGAHVRVTVSGSATRSLYGDALAGASAALAVLAEAMPGAVIDDLRVYAIDVEGYPRQVHPCPAPPDVAPLLTARAPRDG